MLVYVNNDKVVICGEKELSYFTPRDLHDRGYKCVGKVQGSWLGVVPIDNKSFIALETAKEVDAWKAQIPILPKYMIPRLAKQLSDQNKMLMALQKKVS